MQSPGYMRVRVAVRSAPPLAERFKRVATRLCLGARTRGSIVSLGPHAAHSLLLATSRAAAHEAAHGREDLTRQVLPLLASSKVLRQAQHGQNVRFDARQAKACWPL